VKLLFDENLSPKLVVRLADSFPNSLHVRDVGLQAANDPTVWEYARDNDLVIVSKDSDMHQRSFLFGAPPKVVWVRLGNCSTTDVENLLRDHMNALNIFNSDEFASFLSLSRGDVNED
jgi:predicted nuclease of predicted toxin-antitoxin system